MIECFSVLLLEKAVTKAEESQTKDKGIWYVFMESAGFVSRLIR